MFENGKKFFILGRGRQLFLFLFCLFLAFVIWTVHKLSDQYSHSFQYRVYADVSIKGRATDSESLTKLVVRGRASGFYILQHRFSKKGAVVSFAPERSYFKKVPDKNDLFYLLTSEIRDIIVESVEDKLNVDYLSVDTLFFDYPRIGGKEVPVAVKSRATFKEQYMPTTNFRVKPSTILISGNADLLKSIDSVYTSNINIYNADSPLSGFIKLESIKGVEFSDKEVFYSLEVERYFEEIKEAKVSIINVPDSIDVSVSPKTISLILRSSMKKLRQEMDNNFSVVIDFISLNGSEDTLVTASPQFLPQGVISYRTDPPYIHCSVLSKNKNF